MIDDLVTETNSKIFKYRFGKIVKKINLLILDIRLSVIRLDSRTAQTYKYLKEGNAYSAAFNILE